MTMNQQETQAFDSLRDKLDKEFEQLINNIRHLRTMCKTGVGFKDHSFPSMGTEFTETARRLTQATMLYGLIAAPQLMGDRTEDCDNGEH